MPDLDHWAQTTPDAPALVGPNGSRSFAELDANANRLARALRNRGLVAGDAVALARRQPADLRRGRLRLPAGRVPPHADQLAPHRRRGRLHRRRLRGQGARHRRRARVGGRSRASAAAPACKVAPGRRRDDRRVRVATRRRWPPRRRAARRPRPRHDDALHVGHDRPTQGGAPTAAGRGGRGAEPRSATTRPAAPCTCAPGRCTTPRRWRSR